MARVSSALYITLLLFSMVFASVVPAGQALADTDAARWSVVNLPRNGVEGGWVLADGSDVRHLTRSIDGTLYCYANPSATDFTLFKSTNGGYGWSHVGKVKDSIVDIAVARDDAGIICYATVSRVYISSNYGESFILLPPGPGGAGSNNIEITSVDIGRRDGRSIVAVGTRDTDASQYGGVYLFDVNSASVWDNRGVGSYDVYAVAFSPEFAVDGQLLAVVTDEADTFITSQIGEGVWGSFTGMARLDRNNSGTPTPVAVDTSATIAFSDGYSAFVEDAVFYVGIDAGAETGDVYQIKAVAAPGNSVATDLNTGSAYGSSNVDITSLAVAGSGDRTSLVAGAAGSARVYSSSDDGDTWSVSTKPPTGGSSTCVVVVPGVSGQGIAYAATGGIGSAFSYSVDGGITWNQVSLIDTRIDSIVDVAISPEYDGDSTIFLLTFSSKHSLWRSLDGGARWERVFAGFLPNVDNIDRITLSPRYGSGSRVVFMAGQSNGSPAIWKSTDAGQSFSAPRSPRDPASGGIVSIDVWAVVDDNALFVGSFDGSNGVVYRTENSGLFYSARAAAGTQPIDSIALSPSFAQDRTILAGNAFGRVYRSQDNGETFAMLGSQLPDMITGGSTSHSVSVAFDAGYSGNNTVYAASHCKKGTTNSSAIYRFVAGKSTVWESIGTMPAGAVIDRLVVSARGVLYAVDSRTNGGVQRCLDPTYSLGPSFAVASDGLDTGFSLVGLWLQDEQLWSTDAVGIRLITYFDSLSTPVLPVFPADSAAGIGIENVSLDWNTLKGATTYEWQVDSDTDFSSVPAGFRDTTGASSARLPELQYATKYYWRVRATAPVPSPWSTRWTFVTMLGSTVVAPELHTPKAGAAGIAPKPVFQWSAVAGAERYELLVSDDVSFVRPVVVKVGDYALPTNAWQCDVSLDYGTTFYWRVRATGSNTNSAWSAVSAFTTAPLAEPPAEQPQPAPEPESLLTTSSLPTLSPNTAPLAPSPVVQPYPSPQPQPQAATPEWVAWVIRLGIAFVLTMIAILVTMVFLTVRLWKL